MTNKRRLSEQGTSRARRAVEKTPEVSEGYKTVMARLQILAGWGLQARKMRFDAEKVLWAKMRGESDGEVTQESKTAYASKMHQIQWEFRDVARYMGLGAVIDVEKSDLKIQRIMRRGKGVLLYVEVFDKGTYESNKNKYFDKLSARGVVPTSVYSVFLRTDGTFIVARDVGSPEDNDKRIDEVYDSRTGKRGQVVTNYDEATGKEILEINDEFGRVYFDLFIDGVLGSGTVDDLEEKYKDFNY